MGDLHLLESNLDYARQLVAAGWDGMNSKRMKKVNWTPSAIGATLGMLSTGLINKRRSPSYIVIGGVLGSALGFGVALAWSPGSLRSALRSVNAARDAHWLQAHPITYA